MMTQELHAMRCEAPVCFGVSNWRVAPWSMWYPHEPICGLRTNERDVRRVRRNQRRIVQANRNDPPNPEFDATYSGTDRDWLYFTSEDLLRLKRIDRRIRGENPDGRP